MDEQRDSGGVTDRRRFGHVVKLTCYNYNRSLARSTYTQVMNLYLSIWSRINLIMALEWEDFQSGVWYPIWVSTGGLNHGWYLRIRFTWEDHILTLLHHTLLDIQLRLLCCLTCSNSVRLEPYFRQVTVKLSDSIFVTSAVRLRRVIGALDKCA